MNTTAVYPMRNRIPLFALLGANVVSMVGNVTALIAIPWFVLVTTGSPARTGIAAAVTAVPMIISGIFGGTIVDRLGFKRMSVISDIASSVAVALIPLLHLTIGLEFWQLLVLIFLGALLDAPGMTARNSLLPDLARVAGMRLERANTAEQSISRFSLMFGAPLAGVLIAWIGVTHVLWFNAASFIVSAAIVAMFVPSAGVTEHIEKSPSSYLDDLREGFTFLRGDRLILTMATVVAILNFLDAMVSVIYPVYAERIFGSAVSLGLIYTASGAGALVTLLLFGVIGHRLPRRETYIGAFILAGLPLWVFIATPVLSIVIVASLVRGFGAGPLNPIGMTIMQERIPVELRGRVFGLLSAGAWIAMPAGRLLSGICMEAFGLIPTFAVVAAFYLATTASLLLIPALHEMNQRTSPEDAPNRPPLHPQLISGRKGKTT
jgi:MFS family permease